MSTLNGTAGSKIRPEILLRKVARLKSVLCISKCLVLEVIFLSERDIIPEKIIPEPTVIPDGMFQCPRCNQTFATRDIYEDHFTAEHE
jgi:hypothetical protein